MSKKNIKSKNLETKAPVKNRENYFSKVERKINLMEMETQELDLFIIGGGITGAGVARDAAARGMKVGLVEKNDFAYGTSSRSSKLVHGGIRYLENLEFHLVFEALSERAKLFEMAPHLVHPLRFMLPLYEDGRVGMFKMGLGMWLYDALSLFRAPELHEKLGPQETIKRMPDLKSEKLLGSFVYSDAYMDDDRLTIETLRSAQRLGAYCANYVQVQKVEKLDGSYLTTCYDLIKKKTFTVKSKHLVSCVGPWTDIFGNLVRKDWKSILRPTKGIHLTFNKNRLHLPSAMVMASGKDNRIVFGIPRHEMTIIGTTDTDFKGSPDDVVASIEDVDYLLAIASEYFPGAQLTKEDIIASYSGVRPLVQDGSSTEGKTSREHTIFTDSSGITFVAGGKYTTYRKMAEDILKEVLCHFDIEDRVKFKGQGVDTAIALNPKVTSEKYLEAQERVLELKKETKLSLQEAQWLIDRHGLEAFDIVQEFGKALTYIELEAHHAISKTLCLNLVDFYARRVPIFLSQVDHGLEHLELLGELFAEFYGWNEEELTHQKELVKNHIEKELHWKGEKNLLKG
jgi:glycerol-3-phosphate dehydrogenase